MKKALVFDTETTGKALMRLPVSHPSQPHIVQLAALLVDENGCAIETLNRMVRPQGWAIPPEAAAIHGITTERAATLGVPLWRVMAAFADLCEKADVVVAHNIEFDSFMLAIEAARLGVQHPLASRARFCTMKGSMYICNIPSPYKKAEPKWPTLDEAHRALIGRSVEGAHDAMVDVEACARLYLALQQRAAKEAS